MIIMLQSERSITSMVYVNKVIMLHSNQIDKYQTSMVYVCTSKELEL